LPALLLLLEALLLLLLLLLLDVPLVPFVGDVPLVDADGVFEALRAPEEPLVALVVEPLAWLLVETVAVEVALLDRVTGTVT
jgi:hypothetical protein